MHAYYSGVHNLTTHNTDIVHRNRMWPGIYYWPLRSTPIRLKIKFAIGLTDFWQTRTTHLPSFLATLYFWKLGKTGEGKSLVHYTFFCESQRLLDYAPGTTSAWTMLGPMQVCRLLSRSITWFFLPWLKWRQPYHRIVVLFLVLGKSFSLLLYTFEVSIDAVGCLLREMIYFLVLARSQPFGAGLE